MTTPAHPPPHTFAAPTAPADAAPTRLAEPIASDRLFAGATEVQIVHHGVLYRLKQTALGKLILTK